MSTQPSRFLKTDGVFNRPIDWGAITQSPVNMPATPAQRSIQIPATQAPAPAPVPTQAPMQSAAAPAPSQDYATPFNTMMMDLLKSAQGVGTADLLKRKRELERAALTESSQMTPEALRPLSPAQQEAIRSGNVSALEPEIDQNAYEIKKAEQAIDNFFTIFDRAQKISADYAEKMAPPQESVDAMVKVIASNPDQFDKIFGGLNAKGQDALVKALAAKGVSLTSEDTRLDRELKKAQIANTYSAISDRNAGSVPSADAQEKKAEALALAQNLRGQAVGKSSAVGASVAKLIPFAQSAGLQPNRTAFEARVNTLKSNLTLDNLKLLKGAMSDKDLLFLQAIGSSLDTNMAEEEFNKELDKIIGKLGGTAGGGNIVTAPDGTLVEITD